VKQGLILKQKAEKDTYYLNEFYVRHPLMLSISQRSEELRLYILVSNLTISNLGLKVVSSNASPGCTVRFFFFG
jgi:hypothetical protein